jgi:hypothetical protein
LLSRQVYPLLSFAHLCRFERYQHPAAALDVWIYLLWALPHPCTLVVVGVERHPDKIVEVELFCRSQQAKERRADSQSFRIVALSFQPVV